MMVASHTDAFRILFIIRAKVSLVCRVIEGEDAAAGNLKHADDAIPGRASVSTIDRMRAVRYEEYATNAVVLCSKINIGIFDAFQCIMYERTLVDHMTHDLRRIVIR